MNRQPVKTPKSENTHAARRERGLVRIDGYLLPETAKVLDALATRLGSRSAAIEEAILALYARGSR